MASAVCWADLPSAESSDESSGSASDEWTRTPTRHERQQIRQRQQVEKTVYRQEDRRLLKRIKRSLADQTQDTYDCVIGLGSEYAYRVQRLPGDLSKMARAMCSDEAAALERQGYGLRRASPVLFPGQPDVGETVAFTSGSHACRLVYVRVELC